MTRWPCSFTAPLLHQVWGLNPAGRPDVEAAPHLARTRTAVMEYSIRQPAAGQLDDANSTTSMRQSFRAARRVVQRGGSTARAVSGPAASHCWAAHPGG